MNGNYCIQLSILAGSILLGGNPVCIANDGAPDIPQDDGWCGTDESGAIEGVHNLALWTDGIMPYEFDPDVTSEQRAQFLDALAGLEAICDLQFIEHTDEPNWVYVEQSPTDGVSFSSAIGMAGGEQYLRIYHWDDPGVMQHEVMHAAGFYHEQSRPDRDDYVQIIWDNINPQYAGNFNLQAQAIANGPYDFDSIMHYARRSFNINGGATIDVLPPYKKHWQFAIGGADALSVGDIWSLCDLYGGTPPPRRVELLTPAETLVGSQWTPGFTWSASDLADSYHLLVATDPDFVDPVIDVIVNSTSYVHGSSLDPHTIYFWTVIADGPSGATGAFPFPYLHFYTGDVVPEIVYVDDDASPGGPADDWPAAVPDLQTALDMADLDGENVSEIRLAQGVYVPDRGTGNRDVPFRLQTGVTVRGGYAGPGEPDPSLHDPLAFETVLSGDLAGDDLPGFVNIEENTKHIVYAPDGDDSTQLRDVTITGGHADGPSGDGVGAAIKVVNSDLQVVGCILRGNRATSGAAVSVAEVPATPVFYNCLMVGNSATVNGGAVFATLGATPLIASSTLADNEAGTFGGAMRAHYYSHPVLRNIVLWGNAAPNGAELAITTLGGTAPSQITISDSDVSGGIPGVFVGTNATLNWGSGMIDADPIFADPGAGNYRLSSGSPCIDAGNNDYVPGDLETDLDGGPRIVNGTVDMGCYESSCVADLSGDGVVDVNDLLIILAAWGTPDGDVTGDGMTDVDDLLTIIGAWGPCV